MTIRDLTPGPQATAPVRPRPILRVLLPLLLALPGAPLLAAPEPAAIEPETIAAAEPVAVAPALPPVEVVQVPVAKPTTAPAPPAPPSLRQKADAAASATLAALLPHLAGSDNLPLLDRSAMFAGDISRLLAAYDLTQAVPARTHGSTSPAAPESGVQQVLKAAMSLLGTPYRWGGNSPDSGFDCSGLVGYVFRNALGIELPRVSREMATKPDAELIRDRSLLTPGDLVFFGLRGRVNHVGIYVGDGQFLHAPSRGKDVRMDSLASGYWGNRFMQARRVDL
ncbi:C40 family peptidase [Pseudoxanthomonas broegbernensis]|uniref:C40 family peptidase n=1 Tax=Pseudoxanthomonas broegbernensis TaxID=83619 RepID=UPI001820F5DF|nr:cell wall-associated NlpC family hydrolase [Pseudoxanthomonas broegbernensis]